MNSTDRKELIDSCRKFAQKNTFCLYLSIVYITIRITYGVLARYFGIYIYKLLGLAALIAAFIFIGSIMPVSSLGEIEVDDYYYNEEKTESINAEYYQEVQVDKAYEDEWSTILINKQHKIPEDYKFELGTIDGNMKCDSRVIGPLKQMFQDAREQGMMLVVCSPYRNEKRQKFLFNRKVKEYMRNGLSYIEAYKTGSMEVTVPGSSEHEAGLAFDIVSESYSNLDEEFAKTPEGIWLSENSYKYGFILRYPKNKENITGISFEPWHFRYVGTDAAREIKEKNITLEEYTEGL